jgi:hypothetical protein
VENSVKKISLAGSRKVLTVPFSPPLFYLFVSTVCNSKLKVS